MMSSVFTKASLNFCLSPALLICTKGVLGDENRHDEGSAVMRFRGAVSGAMEAVWDASGLSIVVAVTVRGMT